MRAAARALNYDPAYLSRVLGGKQPPSRQLAEGLDRITDSGGRLAAQVVGYGATSVARDHADPIAVELAHMRSSVAHFLDHDNLYGGDTVAAAAVQVWRAGQRRLDRGSLPEGVTREYLAAVAEVAQVAGWLLFDADQQDASRAAFLESHMLARHAGDRSKQWFALDMLAMQNVERHRTGETLRIADELLSQAKLPPRVALLARVRRARALALAGCRRQALDDLDAVSVGLGDSLNPRDPSWTWWVNEQEAAGQRGDALLALGDSQAAVPSLQRACELAGAFRPDGRGVFYYRVSLLSAYARTRAWMEYESTLLSVLPLLETIGSGRNRRRFRSLMHEIARDTETPAWVVDLMRSAEPETVQPGGRAC
ncbi:hypothetical protein I5Q34_17425 [Streptomyces sp. AV19]|nr:hypothetical protein [Streptomyces sp. AV19]